MLRPNQKRLGLTRASEQIELFKSNNVRKIYDVHPAERCSFFVLCRVQLSITLLIMCPGF